MAKNGIISRVKRAFAELRGTTFNFGTNAWDKFLTFIGMGKDEDTGETVTPDSASRLTTVFNCLNALAQDIAQLPKQIRQDSDEGKKVIKNRLHTLMNFKPNRWENAFHFWYGLIFVGEGWGNSYAYIAERDRAGYPTKALRIKPWLVRPEIIEGELYYIVDENLVIHSDDMFHYRSMTTNGPIGESKIVYNAKTIGIKMKQERYKAKSVGNKPPGILFMRGVDQEQRKKNQEIWNQLVSGDNMAGTPVLTGDLDYKQLMMSPEATEIIAQSRDSNEAIQGIWRIPVGAIPTESKLNYNLAEQIKIEYVNKALMPIIVNIEQEAFAKFFPTRNETAENPEYVKFNLKAFLRGDTQTQNELYRMLRSEGIASADEIREWEDMPPQRDADGNIGIGKKYFIQGAMIEIKPDMSQPSKGKDADARTMELLEDFAKKHKLNGYAQKETVS